MDVGRSDRTRRSDFVAEKNQRQELASQVERPVITHVGDCQKNENEHLQLVGEESFEMFEAVCSIVKDALESLRCAKGLTGGCELVVRSCRHCINGGKMSNSQNRRSGLVEFGNLVQNFDSLCLSASADQKFGRFAEGKDKVAQKEDDQSHTSKDDERVSPAHVAGHGAAGSLAGTAGG